MTETAAGTTSRIQTWGEILWAYLKLGLTAFGGPVAHLAYFRDEFVTRRRWIDEKGYADLVALCQFLPGPASSQTVPSARRRHITNENPSKAMATAECCNTPICIRVRNSAAPTAA